MRAMQENPVINYSIRGQEMVIRRWVAHPYSAQFDANKKKQNKAGVSTEPKSERWQCIGNQEIISLVQGRKNFLS